MAQIEWMALSVFVFFFALVTVMGFFAARWKLVDVFGALSSFRDTNGKPFCTDAGVAYSTGKSAICNGAQSRVQPVRGRGSETNFAAALLRDDRRATTGKDCNDR